jgi:hypothetical protein
MAYNMDITNDESVKYSVNVVKSVWRRLRKPCRGTLDAISSRNTVCTSVFCETKVAPELANLGLIGGSVTLNDFAWTTNLTGGYQSRATDGAQLKSGITEKQRDLLVA